MKNSNKTAIVVGAGIVGLACARALAVKGFKVTVYEKNARAIGASIRNFGMVWPVGQPSGRPYECARRSREIWKEICDAAGIWHDESGSLHLAYTETESKVMEEFVGIYGGDRKCAMLSPSEVLSKSEAVNPAGLKGALYSAEELIVDPRDAIAKVADYLQEQLNVEFKWSTNIHTIKNSSVYFNVTQSQQADQIFVCSGSDFESLYPEVFQSLEITKCKLQMMRLVAQPEKWKIGPSLCGGLSMLHYKSFSAAPAITDLRQQLEAALPEYLKWGIHVMVSQNGNTELTIGDSHEYGPCHDPFDRQHINDLIVDYLKRFAVFKDWRMLESWNGVYAKMTNGQDHLLLEPDENVTILNALGGAGMTLSFGLAEFYTEK